MSVQPSNIPHTPYDVTHKKHKSNICLFSFKEKELYFIVHYNIFLVASHSFKLISSYMLSGTALTSGHKVALGSLLFAGEVLMAHDSEAEDHSPKLTEVHTVVLIHVQIAEDTVDCCLVIGFLHERKVYAKQERQLLDKRKQFASWLSRFKCRDITSHSPPAAPIVHSEAGPSALPYSG